MNRKISAILYTILFQCSFVNAITEEQAYVYTALIATGSAFFTSKSVENPRFILGTCVLAGVVAYASLRKYTPAFKMNEVNIILNGLNNNELAKGYREIEEAIETDLVKQTPPATKSKQQYEEKFIKKIYELYPVQIYQQPYPLITAMHELTLAFDNLKLANTFLDATILDIPEAERIEKNTLWSRYIVLSERSQNYTNNVKAAQAAIPTLSSYNEQFNDFNAWQNNQKKLAIEQQTADAAMIAATGAQQQAKAQQDQASAAKSVARLAWIKSWLWYLLGIKSH